MDQRAASPDPTRRTASPFVRRLALITAGALAVRILIIVLVDPHVPELGDASAYHLLANHLADGRGYIRPFDLVRFHLVVPTAEYPPLHPFVLSLFARVGMRSVQAQRLGLAFIGTATVAMIGVVGRQVVGTTTGLVAAGLAAVSPMMFLPEATLMSEALFVLLVTVALSLAGRARVVPSPARFAILGIVLGLGVLTRAEAGVLGLLLIVPIAILAPALSPSRRFALAAVGLGAMVIVVVPWTARNQSTFHAFVPVSNNLGTALAGANCSLTYSGESLGSWRSTFGAGDAAAGNCFTGFNGSQAHFNEAKASAAGRHQGLTFASNHLGDLPTVGVARVLRTFGVFRPGQQIQLESLEGRPHAWEQAGTWLEWAMYPVAIFGFVMLVRQHARYGGLLATLISVVVASLVTYGNQRFRIGAEPAILIAAAVGCTTIARTLGGIPSGLESAGAATASR
jgi:4-amino-4-deoxy-L-arabinose transferase-like glycosyltransferase